MAPRIRYVDTASSSGGDGTTQSHTGANRAYVSLMAALTAEATNLVTFGDNLEINCAGSTADTTDAYAWTGQGWTTDATHKIIIKGDPTAPDNDGLNLGNTYSTAHYRLHETTSNPILRIIGVYVDLIGLQFGSDTSSGGFNLINDEGVQGVNVDRCRFKIIQTPGSSVNALVVASGAYTVTNCTFDWSQVSNSVAIRCLGASHTVTNCTFRGADIGLYIPGGTLTMKNCAVFDCNTLDIFLNGGTLTGSFIAHDDAAVTGETNHIDISPGGTESTDWAAAFAGYTTGDFRVKDSSSVLYNAGTNTGAPAADIIGTTRPQGATVDVGAWELVAAAGPPWVDYDMHVDATVRRKPVGY